MTKPDISDLFLVLGAALSFYGVFSIYPPAAYILLGGFLLYLGWPKDGDKS